MKKSIVFLLALMVTLGAAAQIQPCTGRTAIRSDYIPHCPQTDRHSESAYWQNLLESTKCTTFAVNCCTSNNFKCYMNVMCDT